MRTLFISMIIGIIAGIIDILPMILKKMSKRPILSAFLQYFFVSIIIVNIDLPGIIWWLQGGLISFSMAIPIMIIISEKEMKSIPIISIMSILLGTLIGVAGHFMR